MKLSDEMKRGVGSTRRLWPPNSNGAVYIPYVIDSSRKLTIYLLILWENGKKVTVKEWVFVESAFKMQYHIVKNTLPRTAFSAILPAGLEPEHDARKTLYGR